MLHRLSLETTIIFAQVLLKTWLFTLMIRRYHTAGTGIGSSLTLCDVHGCALAVNSVLGRLLCKEKNSCTPDVQERGRYLLGKMPTLT